MQFYDIVAVEGLSILRGLESLPHAIEQAAL